MGLFKTYLIVVFLVIAAYTGLVIMDHGLNLFAVFFGDMMKLGWPGQFNLDFMFMLSFSALWVIWRNQFSGAGMGLGVLAFLFGAPFLCLYLLYLSAQTQGHLVRMLVGDRALASSVGPN